MDITPIFLKISAVSAILGGIWIKIKQIYKKISPLIEPSVKRAEDLARDGVINRKDRKEIAMGFIQDAQDQKIIRKLGFFEKMILSKVVDILAQKLPDFKFNTKKGGQ